MDKYSYNYNVILDNMDLNEYRLKPIAAIMYMQDAFARYCATRKMAAYDLFPKNLYWIISELNIEFTDKLPFWSEDIRVEIWISEITKLKIYTDFKLYYSDKVFAIGDVCWFLLDTQSKRPAKTDIITENFEICNTIVFGEHKKFALPMTQGKVSGIIHKNNISDLDFNSHVNNKSYINIADASISNEFKETHMLKNLCIKFNKESFLGDVLECSTFKSESVNTFVHNITKDGTSVCDILSSWGDRITDEDILHYDLKVKSENKVEYSIV